MRKKLITELRSLAHNILNMKGQEDISVLKAKAITLYEKLAALEFVESHFGEIGAGPGKNEAMRKFEELAAGVMTENTQVPENNPHEEDLVEPLMYKIKDLVAEMPKEETMDDVLSEVQPNPTFIKKEAQEHSSAPVTAEKTSERRQLSLNDILKQPFHIGLNDRIGFVKHLFNGSDEDFDNAISRLTTMGNPDEARNFVLNTVKPDYNNWDGKEDYETRFLALIEARFDA